MSQKHSLHDCYTFGLPDSRKGFPAQRICDRTQLSDVERIKNLKFTYNDLISYSDHTSGGNQFGADPLRGVTDSSGQVFGTTNVYVADSSLFPTAPGVNPSWTIMALARHVAQGILTRG